MLAAANRRDEAHELAVALVTRLGRQLAVPDAVIVEVDHLLRTRVNGDAARMFLAAIREGEHTVAYATPELVRRAIELDARHADLQLGFCDGSVMAFAERHDAPILTFDFPHFRATRPARGHWRLVVDEARYRAATAAERRP